MKPSVTLGGFIWKFLFTIAFLLIIIYFSGPIIVTLQDVFSEDLKEPIDVTVKLDVSKPKFTKYSLYIPAGSEVKFSASGRFTWDPKVPNGNAGPEGAKSKGKPWHPIFIDYEKNRRIKRIVSPNDFVMPYEPICVLMAEVAGKKVAIGKSRTVIFARGGYLFLAINERWVGHGGKSYKRNWADNSGTITVRIEVSKSDDK